LPEHSGEFYRHQYFRKLLSMVLSFPVFPKLPCSRNLRNAIFHLLCRHIQEFCHRYNNGCRKAIESLSLSNVVEIEISLSAKVNVIFNKKSAYTDREKDTQNGCCKRHIFARKFVFL